MANVSQLTIVDTGKRASTEKNSIDRSVSSRGRIAYPSAHVVGPVLHMLVNTLDLRRHTSTYHPCPPHCPYRAALPLDESPPEVDADEDAEDV
jgi:hypothetical protein